MVIKTVKVPVTRCPNKKCKASVEDSKVYKTRSDRVNNIKKQYRTCGRCGEDYKTEKVLKSSPLGLICPSRPICPPDPTLNKAVK